MGFRKIVLLENVHLQFCEILFNVNKIWATDIVFVSEIDFPLKIVLVQECFDVAV